MEKGVFVEKIGPNDYVEGLFMVASASQGQARNGNPFWSIRLADRTGSIDAKLWYPQCADIDNIEAGTLAHVKGTASLYKNQIQIRLDNFSPLDKSESDAQNLSYFKRASPRDPEDMLKELKLLCLEEFQYAGWRKLVLQVFNNDELRDAFKICPAGQTMHQAYLGGLLEHTLNVFKLCRQIADIYPFLDRQTLLAGAFFHDIGKIYELNSDLAIEYTDQGKLIGHIILGLEILIPMLSTSDLERPLREHLKHLILSHHGELEYGSPRLPATAEACALHYADNLDAKLAHIRDLFEKQGQGRWRKSIDRQFFLPDQTPETQARKNRKISRDEECLSLLKELKDRENPQL